MITGPVSHLPDIKGIGETYFEKMQEFKNLVAHTDCITGKTETYGEILQKTIRAALKMQSEGIKPNDTISICSFMTSDCLIPYYASFFIGAVSANLYPELSLEETTFLMKQVSPRMVFVAPEAVPLIKTALEDAKVDAKIVVFGETSKYLQFSDFLIPSPKEHSFTPYKVKNTRETAVIVFSSGSTGIPKGACLTHYGLLAQIYNSSSLIPPETNALVFCNLHWISATIFTLMAILNGVNRLLFPKFNAALAWEAIEKYKVNVLSLMLFPAVEMFKNGRPKDIDVSSLKQVLLGGAKMSKEQMMHFRKCLPDSLISNLYGQTEINGAITMFNTADTDHLRLMKEKLESVGKPVPGFAYKIVDLETEEILGPNQLGELLVKSDFITSGYYKMDSSHAFDSDGFFRTGDLVYYDEDQCFFIVDRVKQMLKYKTFYLYPSKIEEVFLTHPAVHACVVFGIPHEEDGDHLMGVVVLKESDVGKVSPKEIEEYVNNKVGDHQRLRAGVKIVEKIPVTVTDKLCRRKMRNLVLEGKL
ncbi:hypothetical protein ILUMI_07241 [Ignelater luminosus]|uniref:Luciferin 4-monooxygenase n=1 Tax=Ignelater luminosus TaxID=2038154 RepID=A0A8K0D9N6_IGNLU|nr:hypothetical protein ILUMI_07241 [Ignelater luminosus]